MTDPNRKSLGALLLHGGDWHGIRVMGLGERLAVIGVSAAVAIPTALWLAPKFAEHAFRHAAGDLPCRSEVRSDPGRHDGNDNRRYRRGENRVEALQEPPTNAARPLVEGGVAGGREALAGEDGLVVPEGIGLPADKQPAPLKLNGGDGVRPAELHVPAGVADCREDSVSTSFHAEDSSTRSNKP